MKYELTFLTKEETELKNTKEEKWGEKTLAYSIKKNHTALYFNFQFEIDKKNILELKNKFNLNEKILRYLLLVRE